jgi:hypothetical protein
MRRRRNAHRVLTGNPEGMRPLCRRKHRWDYNIEIEFKETE